MPISVRAGTTQDHDFAVATARRFASFGPPPWRTEVEVVEGEVRCLDDYFDGRMPGCALLVAERDGERLGFAFVEPHVDYFTQIEHGHLGMIAVAETAQGTGAAAALLDAAERWARGRGYATLTLNVFDGNSRARAFYEKSGFRVETVRYTKPLA
jgi:GNAT superfamily N-acetyltransferase